jgi:DNA-binding transcriptional MocR family regulator
VAVHYQIGGRSAAEISASVEAGVRGGALAPQAALPPVRALAARLGVAPATVAAAYAALRRRGLVETAGRNGTRVRHRPPVSTRLARVRPVPPGTVDLAAGAPDHRLLPALGPRLRRLAGSASVPVGYGESGSWPPLVELARGRLAADGVPLAAAGVTVTSGALDAVERLLLAHLRPGDRVAVEDPGWANLLDLVAALGLRPVPVPLDDEGPTVDGVAGALATGVAALVVTSRAQNPTGAAVSPARAAALRSRLAAAPGVLVIEDDHAGELADVALATLAGATDAWAFVRSVSKPYGPDLRLAVVAGDEATVGRVEGRMRLGAGWVSTVLQRLVVEMWTDDAVTALVARARSAYDERRRALVSALAERGVRASGRTGINVWTPVDDETATVTRLAERGWAVGPGSLYRLASPPAVRLTVSNLSPRDVPRLADDVAACLGPDPTVRAAR